MMRPALAISILCGLLAAGMPIHVDAATLDDDQRRALLAEAQQVYTDGVAILRTDPIRAREHFAESALRFQLLVDDGVVNGRLFYNLGNAHLQSGEIGRAILNYRRAQRLIPGDARLESNLSYARTLLRTPIGDSGTRALFTTLLGWHASTSLNGRFGFAMAMYLLFWGVLMAKRFGRSPIWRYVAVTLLPLWMAPGVSVAASLAWPSDQTDYVLVADDVIVRKGNGDGFEPQFEEPLHQGVECTLLERRVGWLHVSLPDESTGWVSADQAQPVGLTPRP